MSKTAAVVHKKKFKISSIPSSAYIFCILFVAFSLIIPNFFSPTNLSNLLLQASPLVIISVGMSLVIMTGCIDLSVGGNISMCGVIMATLLFNGMHAVPAILCGLAIGTCFGLLNGFIVQKMKVAAFIATFGMMGVAESIANILSKKRTVYWETGPQNTMIKSVQTNLFQLRLGPKPSQVLSLSFIVIVCVLIVVTVLYVFKKTSFWAHIYAVGSNEEIARLNSISPVRIRMTVYAISGFLAAVASLLYMSRINSAQPTMGDGLEFQAIVAAIIGGNTLRGGKGSVPGAILGALSLFAVRNALSLAGVGTSWVQVFIGVVLIAGMTFNALIEWWEHEQKSKGKALKAEGDGKK